MAGETESAAINGSVYGAVAAPSGDMSGVITNTPVKRGDFTGATRGKFRLFNAAEYRFYRSLLGPPKITDDPFETTSSLPYETTAVWGDGVWYVSMSYFNGVLDSGFFQVGEEGEDYYILEISGGVEVSGNPKGPNAWGLRLKPSGVVNVTGWYNQSGVNRAEEFVITFTTDGSTPAEDTAGNHQITIPTSNIAVLDYDLAGQADSTTVKVRLQMRRDLGGGSYVYSRGSTVLTATADGNGPGAPDVLVAWYGPLPSEI